MKIATCIYDTDKSKLGGRLGRLPRYCGSLNIIAKYCPDINIYCFTDHHTYELIRSGHEYLLKNFNIEFVFRDLCKSDYHRKIQHLRNNIELIQNYNPVRLSNRCFELIYQKLIWMREYGCTFWIDSGLLHGDVFPLNNVKNTKERNNFIDLDILNGEKLLKLDTKYSSIFFYHNRPNNKNYKIYDTKFSYIEEPSAIGGLFKVDNMNIHNHFYNELDFLLDNNVLVTEESIFTHILKNYKIKKCYFDYMGIHKKNDKQKVSLKDALKDIIDGY